MSKPIIGLTTYPSSDTHGWHTPLLYVQAVARAGGAPVMLPGSAENCAEEWLDAVDGVVFIGGGDINPEYFGSAGHETIYNLSAERDRSEIALMKALLAKRKPALLICRGLQVLNIVLGGTLFVHLPDVFGEKTLHRAPPREPILHSIRIAPESRLAQTIGSEVETASWHHQAIDRLGEGLVAVGWAEDGVVEAVEMPDYPELVAVQWHPEITAPTDDNQLKLFEQLVLRATQVRSAS